MGYTVDNVAMTKSVRIDAALHGRLRIAAAIRGVQIQEAFAEAVSAWLEPERGVLNKRTKEGSAKSKPRRARKSA